MSGPSRNWRFVGLLLLLLLAFLLDISAGPVRIPLGDIFRTLFSSSAGNDTWQFIVEKIRLPKALTAVLAGCGLSVGGLQMQTLFLSTLAAAGVLGIAAGASQGVAMVMLTAGSIETLYAIKELGVSG